MRVMRVLFISPGREDVPNGASSHHTARVYYFRRSEMIKMKPATQYCNCQTCRTEPMADSSNAWSLLGVYGIIYSYACPICGQAVPNRTSIMLHPTEIISQANAARIRALRISQFNRWGKGHLIDSALASS